jgi:tripartite-type tricarboxylate transporter receptor subunit TctC
MSRRSLMLSAAAAGGIMALPRQARAAFPDRPLRILVGFAAGGTVDSVARVLANGMGPILGQQVVIENKPGGSGSIAANALIASPADGHTLLFGIFSLAVAPALAKLAYDTTRDLTAVSQVASVPLFMLTTAHTPFKTVADVIAAAKAAPDTITYASAGVGSSGHMAAELFTRHTGIKLIHVPFRGAAPATQALVAEQVQLLFDTPTTTMRDLVAQQKLRALAVMSDKELPAFAGIPPIGGMGLGGDLSVQAWQGLLVRTGTPPDIIATLNKAIVTAMNQPDTRQRIAAVGVEPMATSAAAFDAFFKSEVARWTDVARRAGISAQ